MKSPSADLHDLVKSLTKPEKRFFKLYATRHLAAGNHYTKLFSLIDKQAVYDEKELTAHFQNRKSSAHFAVVKKQLYENILEALHRFDEFAQPEQKIRKGIHYATLLLKKGLFGQCQKQLKKYKALAYQYEKFENIAELIEIEKRLINKLQFSTISYQQMEQLQQEQDFCLQQLERTGNYWIRSNTIFKMHYEKKIAPGKPNVELNALIEEPQFSDISQATTFKARLDYLQINALHAFVNNQVENAYALNAKFIQLLDEHEHLKLLNADRYFSVLNNYLIDSLVLQKTSELKKGIQTLRHLPTLPEFRHIQNLDANVFRLSYLLEMNYYVSAEKFSDALDCIQPIQTGLRRYADKIAKPNVITLRYLVAYTYFCNRQFNACLDELLVLMHTKDVEQISDIYRDSRMMQLLCHFELGDYLLLDSLITSLQRYLQNHKQQQTTYKVLLRYIKQCIQKPEKPDLSGLARRLKELSGKENEKPVFNNFNYMYWLKHITGKK